jgi:hypothetical protein
MMLRNAEGLVRLNMLALPLAGLLALVGLYSTIKPGSGGILATADNRAIVSAGYFVSVLLGNVLALTVLIFGVVALYACLANGGQRTLALGAMVSSIVGLALMLSRAGVFANAVPALSRSFLNGKPESIRDATCRASEFPRDVGDSAFRWMSSYMTCNTITDNFGENSARSVRNSPGLEEVGQAPPALKVMRCGIGQRRFS